MSYFYGGDFCHYITLMKPQHSGLYGFKFTATVTVAKKTKMSTVSSAALGKARCCMNR